MGEWWWQRWEGQWHVIVVCDHCLFIAFQQSHDLLTWHYYYIWNGITYWIMVLWLSSYIGWVCLVSLHMVLGSIPYIGIYLGEEWPGMNQVIPGGILGNIPVPFLAELGILGMEWEWTRNDTREFTEFHCSNIPGSFLVDSPGIHQELVGECKELPFLHLSTAKRSC